MRGIGLELALLGVLVCLSQCHESFLSNEALERFKENYRRVEEHNLKLINGETTYETILNEFSSMSHEELNEKLLNKHLNETKPEIPDENSPPPTMQNDWQSLPRSFDWRSKGKVTRVRHQGSCGTCWSFCTVGAVETLYANKYGQLIEMSEQDLNDCLTTGAYRNWGCNGGYPSNAFHYAVTKGLAPLNQAPYQARDGYCNNNIMKRYKVTGYRNIPYGDENAIKEAVAKYGPVTVAIDASEWGFAYYSSGIYISRTCNPNSNNHAVLVVGYGSENGVDYWIIKNSWGPSWGENGYIRMARNRNNMCGIASMASFAYM